MEDSSHTLPVRSTAVCPILAGAGSAGGEPLQPLLLSYACLGDEGLAGVVGDTGGPEEGVAADACSGHISVAHHQPQVDGALGLSLLAEECQNHSAQLNVDR